ncbi:MAG: hypothetical protein WA771_12315 [Chthoniobacterales bacterium]
MSLRSTAAALSEGSKELSRHWQDTRESWRDTKAREFSETYLEPIPTTVAKSVEAMAEIERFLKKVRAECE